MNIRRNSKSALFLMEMIIMILFFAVASGICVNLFAKAAIMRDRSSDLTNGMIQAQSIAETFKHYDGDIKSISEKLQATTENDCLVIYFDENWSKTNIKDSYTYKAIVSSINVTPTNLVTSEVSVSKLKGEESSTLCSLRVSKYIS